MLFVIGGVIPFLYALALLPVLPESPRYVRPTWKRWDEPLRTVFQRDFLRDTLALLAAFFSCLLAVYLGFGWLTSLLVSAGFDPATASNGITAFNLGGVVGALAGSVVIGRFGSRMPMLLMAAAAAFSGVILAFMTIEPSRPLAIMTMLTIVGGLINGVQVTLYALAAHIYPSIVRATGVGTASVVGRTGAIVSGYAGAWAIDYRGSASYFALIAVAMVSTLIALACIKRHVKA
jgi:AAHS family 4-hydroxybenzoate transporter-like MFS transporter